jgi:hypothetical protein
VSVFSLFLFLLTLRNMLLHLCFFVNTLSLISYPPPYILHTFTKIGGSESEIPKDDRDTTPGIWCQDPASLVSEAEELGSVVAACHRYGIPRRTYYYWHSRWLENGKQLTSLCDLPRAPKSHTADLDEETVSLIVQLRLGLGYGEDALACVLKRDYGVSVSRHGIGNVLKRAGRLSSVSLACANNAA